MTAVVGRQPFISLTFVFFAVFSLSLALVPDGYGLIVAFIVYGLREVGEPARKALITSLLPTEIRAEGIGLYWGLRSLAICWASLVGALVWYALGPSAPPSSISSCASRLVDPRPPRREEGKVRPRRKVRNRSARQA